MEDLAARIEHTLLRPEARPVEIDRLVLEAREHRFHAVCVAGVFVPQVAALVRASPLKACTVIGFPLGANDPAAKRAEAGRALEAGADELDMVLWIGGLKAGLDRSVAEDIRGVASLVREGAGLLKVILETALLNDEEKRRACALAEEAGAHFVKTSTGFASAGARVADVALMRAAIGSGMGVKAAGGIRTLAEARALVRAGADRLGTSGSVELLRQARTRHP